MMEKSYIGIISAMPIEVEYLLGKASIDHVDTIGGREFHVGRLCGQDVVITQAGVGKALSAAGAAAMLSRFPVTSVLFTGIAGGVGDETRVLDVVIATDLIQHDYGFYTQNGFEWSPLFSGTDGHCPCDPGLVDLACKAAADVVGETHIHRGLVATGDQFVASEAYVKLLRERFGAIACEMEGASVAAVCSQYKVPCVVIRTMSDKADGNASSSFEQLAGTAADNSGRIVTAMLEMLSSRVAEKD